MITNEPNLTEIKMRLAAKTKFTLATHSFSKRGKKEGGGGGEAVIYVRCRIPFASGYIGAAGVQREMQHFPKRKTPTMTTGSPSTKWGRKAPRGKLYAVWNRAMRNPRRIRIR